MPENHGASRHRISEDDRHEPLRSLRQDVRIDFIALFTYISLAYAKARQATRRVYSERSFAVDPQLLAKRQ
jgi:hypothetical protein